MHCVKASVDFRLGAEYRKMSYENVNQINGLCTLRLRGPKLRRTRVFDNLRRESYVIDIYSEMNVKGKHRIQQIPIKSRVYVM